MNEIIKAAPNGAVQRASVVGALAQRLECDPAKLVPMLKKTAFATCKTDEEFMAMCIVANTYGLNPILKEVYAFPAKGGQVVPIVSVDGWIKLMNSNPNFDGIEFDEGVDYCTATIYRKDRNHPIRATEWLGECAGNTEPWSRWPKRMLRHKALIQCARIAFGFAGIYDEDEGRRIAEATEAEVNRPPVVPQSATDTLRERLGLKTGKDLPEKKDAPQAAVGGSGAKKAKKDAGKKDGELPLGGPDADSDIPY